MFPPGPLPPFELADEQLGDSWLPAPPRRPLEPHTIGTDLQRTLYRALDVGPDDASITQLLGLAATVYRRDYASGPDRLAKAFASLVRHGADMKLPPGYNSRRRAREHLRAFGRELLQCSGVFDPHSETTQLAMAKTLHHLAAADIDRLTAVSQRRTVEEEIPDSSLRTYIVLGMACHDSMLDEVLDGLGTLLHGELTPTVATATQLERLYPKISHLAHLWETSHPKQAFVRIDAGDRLRTALQNGITLVQPVVEQPTTYN